MNDIDHIAIAIVYCLSFTFGIPRAFRVIAVEELAVDCQRQVAVVYGRIHQLIILRINEQFHCYGAIAIV